MYKLPSYHLKNILRTIAFIFLFVVQLDAAAQKNSIHKDSILKKYTDPDRMGFSNTKPYYIILSEDMPKSLQIIRRLDENIAIIKINSRSAYDSLKIQATVTAANDSWKWSPALEQPDKKAYVERKYILLAIQVDSLLSTLKTLTSEVAILFIDRPSNSVVIRCKRKNLRQLVTLPEVIFIDAVKEARPEAGIMGYDRSFHGINAVDYLIPGANGKNIVTGVKEQKMDEADIDLWKRVLPSPIAASTISFHATVIASIIGGAGNNFYDGRGIGWGCKFFPSSFSNLFADDATVLNSNRVSVQNHSYGTEIQQFYGAEAISYDVLTWNNKNFVPVFSAGNLGESAASNGRYANLPGYANLTGNFKMAKNIITVGAIDNKEIIPPQSSAGPLYDGRVAPQLIALGPGGTSDAAAIVSGTIAVIQQVFSDSNNSNLPPASLTKAVLYNTTDDIYKTGIDYKTGYGLLNSFNSIRSIQEKKYDGSALSNGQQWTKNFTVPVNAAALKVTLVWTDIAATVNNNKALINDLDLEVIDISSGTIYQPWVLSTSAHVDSLAKPATRGRDTLNTTEQVSIPLPPAGNYEIRVKGTAVSNPPIFFNIAYKTDTLNTFYFTSPLHASDVNKAENENIYIRWITFVADTNQTGKLSISYNNGITWQLITQSVKLISRKYLWQVKDTNSTAVLKMETGFGDFISTPFIISKLTKLQVDFKCADSFRLSWNKHVYANAYRLFTLTDSPYLKPILVITDTFVVLHRSDYPSLVYAVEPLLSNSLPAARSPALNIELQGVHCFYRTLNYDLLDYNKLNLILELSVATYIDSVYFEKVTVSGELLQVYGGKKVNSNNLIYTHIVNDLEPGITYVRARIRLSNGSIIYTDILQVLTSGKKYIRFYPNPASRNAPLNYSLQQGVPTSSKLLLFDSYGRLLKSYSSMPGIINISGLAPGVTIYKLLSIDNQVLETGKLIIH